MRRMNVGLTAALIWIGLSALAPVAAEKIAITGGTVHTVGKAGVLSPGTVLIDGNKIISVHEGAKIPAGYRIIDVPGRIVTPGFVNAFTNLGLGEVELSGGTTDYKADLAAMGAALDAGSALNMDSSLIPITRMEGVTLAASAPIASLTIFGGQGAVIRLTEANPVIKPRAFMVADLSEKGAKLAGNSHAAAWAYLEAALDEAEEEANSKATQREGLLPLTDRKALTPVISGDLLLMLRVNRKADIAQVLALKSRRPKLHLAILDGREAWRLADELAAADIPIILNPYHNQPKTFDSLAATSANAARLQAAGAIIAFSTYADDNGNHNTRLIPQMAGNAIVSGLPPEAAMKAVTLNPMKIFGLDKTHGSLEPGKAANIVVWSGDPFEVMEAPTHVMIAGEMMPLTSRQTKLAKRYLGLDKGDGTFANKRPE